MNRPVSNAILFFMLLFCGTLYPQTDTLTISSDSLSIKLIQDSQKKLAEIEQLRKSDSVKKVELESQLKLVKETDQAEIIRLQSQLKAIDEMAKQRLADKKANIDSLRTVIKGFPVIGVMRDTLFRMYSKRGDNSAMERANAISKKIKKLYDDDFLKIDSIVVVPSESTYDIVYGEAILLSISETDALWHDKSMPELAEEFKVKIQDSIVLAKNERSWFKILTRIGLALFVIGVVWFLLFILRKGFERLSNYISGNKEKFLSNLSYKDYTFLSAEQEMRVVLFLLKGFRWFIFILVMYFSLPVIFSIFPFSRNWADLLFQLVWSPFRGILFAIWDYLPNLFSILVIYFVMKYFIRFVKYMFNEIESEKLQISGFHSDWAKPTFGIIRFLLYAFMFILIFPYLPGSDSDIFKGVSVFIGILFSLGSSNAIANMVAGLVITYMRPFKIGDRIKIGDVTGDVLEKTILVTRIKTTKNEVITIPNASVLSGNTTNYTSEASDKGLIIYTTVTIGYDVPWKKMHEALMDAALRTDFILKEPKPFVLQTGLEDFYVAYQINAYTREASKQALLYSILHQNIQDVCNERGIEILSPHYRAARDGNSTTIPADYLPKDYKAPGFNVNLEKG